MLHFDVLSKHMLTGPHRMFTALSVVLSSGVNVYSLDEYQSMDACPLDKILLARMQLVRYWSTGLSIEGTALLWCDETCSSFCAACLCSAISAAFA